MNLKLKSKIVERFFNQANFAQIIKTDETVVSRVIHGRREIPVEVQKVWAEALNCKPGEIFES